MPTVRGGKAFQVSGLKELEAKLRDLREAMNPEEVKAAGLTLSEVVTEATEILYRRATQEAARVNLPGDAREDIFRYTKRPANLPKKQYSTLVGVRKRGGQIASANGPQRTDSKTHRVVNRKWAAAGYREWSPGGSWGAIPGGYLHSSGKRVLKKGLVSGRLIGEHLGTMWERGTSKMRKRRWFADAVFSTRGVVLQHIANGVRGIIEQFARAA